MAFMFLMNGFTYEYTPFHSLYEVEPSVSSYFYGISLQRYDEKQHLTLAKIAGITTSREKILKLAELLAGQMVSPYHFRDVVEDFLTFA